MQIFASIRDRLIWITGWPQSGWRTSDPLEAGAKELAFDFEITSDGDGGFLLCYRSVDRQYKADTSHPTIEEAINSAETVFGIHPPEWRFARPK